MRNYQNKSSRNSDDLSRKRLGDYGERRAVRWYQERGFKILATQWRTAGGELDVVAATPGLIVFCEVKTRSSYAFGSPLESVTLKKQQRVRVAASAFLREAEHPYAEHTRFDVAAITGAQIEVFEDAF